VRGSRPAGDPRGTGSRGSTGRKSGGQKSGGQKSGGQRSGGQRGAQQSRGRTSGGNRNQQQRRRPQRSQQRDEHPVVRSTDPVAAAPHTPAGPATGVDMSLSFADMGLPEPVVRELTQQGLVHPFPIQAAAIPDGLAGRDVLGRGPTGSGKTFTFGLPVVTRLVGGASKPGHPRGLVLVPTRELAQQVAGRLRPLAESVGQRVIEIVGGVNIKRHITALARPVDILVATPGRAEDLIGQGKLFFDSVETIALDEADQMADMGFLPQVRRLLDRTPSDAQHLFFSATLDGDIKVLIQRYMNDPVTHSTGEVAAKVERMDHYLGVVPDKPARNDVVIELGLASTKTIMFMRTKHTVDRQVKKLVRAGVPAVGLHGNKGQGARTRAIGEFADGTATVLVATDIAARGIDIKGVDLVVHIDPPAEHKAYVHRAGRTARAGERGTVLTLTTAETEKDTLAMMKKAGVTPTVWRLGTHGIGDHLTDLGLTARGAARGKKPGSR
jgi:superfamily II DNA/RNA helicase